MQEKEKVDSQVLEQVVINEVTYDLPAPATTTTSVSIPEWVQKAKTLEVTWDLEGDAVQYR